ncbi:MAG: PEP-CTERM sorting domain-containing protein [Phycisphaerales bacterium]|nr:MAG: PEP-CTERM sorting domain-containing protein [Phycisphaerales bacterium]
MQEFPIHTALAALVTITFAYTPADALTLDFEILASQRWERFLVPPDIVTQQDLTFEPVTFDFSTVFEPIVIDVVDSWDPIPSGDYRKIYTRFSDPTYVSLTPFDAEMNAQNVWGLGPLTLSPWYHGYGATDVMFADGSAASALNLTYALHAMDGDRLYHHIVSLHGTNPSYPPPAPSMDDMVPWTSEMLLTFINHAQTQWTFIEIGRSEEAHEVNGDVVYTFYDEVFYVGTATLIPEPTTVALLGFAALTLVCRRNTTR